VEQQANMAAYYYNCLDSQKGFDPCGAYYFPEDAEKCRERARVWRAANNCVDKFRPALNNFITDPNYLRKAEEERRRQTGSGGGLDNDLIKQAGSNNVNSF
ncbi:MAG: hypothetical protein NTY45_08110, partial [Elusimicrobia bacterium]|nr:hypothetical protein [Elusimicrobiota bacterium]